MSRTDWRFWLAFALAAFAVSDCAKCHVEQLVTIRTTPASLIECTAKMLKAGDPRALLGPVACAEWSATECEVILPSGLAAALPLLMAMGPDAVLSHELAHCTEHDYHNDFLPWVDK